MYISYYSKPQSSFTNDISSIEKTRDKIITKVTDERPRTNNMKHIENGNAILLTRLSRDYMARLEGSIDEQYTEFRIPKAKGGYRTILAPSDELKRLQKKIQTSIIKYAKFLAPNPVHGFVKYRNTLSAMKVHQDKGSRWFLKVDIKDYFPSITTQVVREALEEVYPFCAHSGTWDVILRPCFLEDGSLPQGSPASPVLTNIAMVSTDIDILEAFPTLTYTRYADDMLFSSPTHFDWRHVQNKLIEILGRKGLKIKESKTRYGNCNGSNWNLGLMYNKDLELTVGYKQKKLLKNRVHNLYRDKPEGYGEDYWEWRSELASIAGTLGYYRYIEPEYFNNLINKYKDEGKEDLVEVLGCDF